MQYRHHHTASPLFLNKLKEELIESENVINLYIQEQNQVLDYQEKKFKEVMLEKRKKIKT
jgi:hypothetical protein